MSKFDLSRKFKEATNLTIIEFVNYRNISVIQAFDMRFLVFDILIFISADLSPAQ